MSKLESISYVDKLQAALKFIQNSQTSMNFLTTI
jgi:hypothetical protein